MVLNGNFLWVLYLKVPKSPQKFNETKIPYSTSKQTNDVIASISSKKFIKGNFRAMLYGTNKTFPTNTACENTNLYTTQPPPKKKQQKQKVKPK